MCGLNRGRTGTLLRRKKHPLKWTEISGLDLEYRCASIQRDGHQWTTHQVRAAPGRRRWLPTKCQPTDLQVVKRLSKIQGLPPLIRQRASINRRAEVLWQRSPAPLERMIRSAARYAAWKPLGPMP